MTESWCCWFVELDSTGDKNIRVPANGKSVTPPTTSRLGTEWTQSAEERLGAEVQFLWRASKSLGSVLANYREGLTLS